jgi:hypothetical protein
MFSIVPCGTDISFLHHFPALRTGLLSPSPSGTSLRRILLIPMLTRMGGCRTSTKDGVRAFLLFILRTTRQTAMREI